MPGPGIVNVVIVDQGVNRNFIPAANWGSGAVNGWTTATTPNGTLVGDPGTAPFGHGTRMALAVLAVAPRAMIYDVPLLPPRIFGDDAFLSNAHAVYEALKAEIGRVGGRWVLCNAWSVYNLAGDTDEYGSNPEEIFTKSVEGFDTADIVFAAGNSASHAPDSRCGSGQIGPGRSIFGAAALPNVLTVGAVRTDRVWLGYSSQGPVPAGFGPSTNSKPDLVAPSQFAYGPNPATAPAIDPHWSFTGSSTACALAAGAVAAIRNNRAEFMTKVGKTQLVQQLRGAASPAAPAPGGVNSTVPGSST